MRNTLPIVLLLFSSCFLFEEDEKDEQNTNLTLSLHSAGVTTVNLNVSPEDSLAEFTFELTRDDSTVQTLSIQSDTLIKDTGLNPNTSYTYKGYWLYGTERISESDSLTVTTMDTTSHNFTWEIDTLGAGGSYLKDVWIVDENNIWAVGNIETDSGWYNLAKWNGTNWNLELVGNVGSILYSIFYFYENDVWVTTFGLPQHWDGNEWTLYHIQQMGLDVSAGFESWGTSSNNMYFVGYKGGIVHYNGNEFVKMESGTDIHLTDIWGFTSDSGENVWVCGWDLTTGQSIVLTLIEGQWQIVYERYSGGNGNSIDHNIYAPSVNAIWTNNKFDYLLVGGGMGLFTMDKYIAHDYEYIDLVEELGYFSFPYKIFGLDINDIFIAGEYGAIFHYNGLRWNYNNTFFSEEIRPRSIHVNNTNIVITGHYRLGIFTNAFVIRGYR